MLTSAQRAKLKAKANTLNPIFQIGKNGLGENQIQDIQTALEAHELVKINVLKNAEIKAKDLLEAVSKATGAEPITAIGNKIVIFRRSTRDDIEHIEI